LDDILYDEVFSYTNKQAAKTFDNLDMIFIEGDVNVLPWDPSMSKILILLRMCIKAKKTLFASAFAMQALVYLTATNLEANINVINGRGRGSKLEAIHDLGMELNSIKHDDYFLDRVTGDLYSFNYETEEWIPKINVGIHHKRDANDPNNALGKYVMKPQAKGDTRIFKGDGKNFITNTKEDLCELKHLYNQHYSLKGLPLQFVVPMRNNWDIHRFNFLNPYKKFVVMAESKQTPQIIYFEPHCVATLFFISNKYPETVQMVQNFINTKLKEIEINDRPEGVAIEKALLQFKGIPNNYFKLSARAQARHTLEIGDTNKISVLRNNTTGIGESVVRPFTNKIYHVGTTFTRHHEAPLIVENNTLRKDLHIKATDPKRTRSSFRIRSTTANTETASRGGQQTIQSLPDLDQVMSKKGDSSRALSSAHGCHRLLTTNNTNNSSLNSIANSHNNLLSRQSYNKNPHIVVGSFDSLDEKIEYVPSRGKCKTEMFDDTEIVVNLHKTRAEIANIVHPDIPTESLFEKEIWVPGQLSKTLQSNRGRNTIRLNPARLTQHFTNYKKFKDIDVDAARSKPCVRTSSEYVSEIDRVKAEQKEADAKNLGPKFLRFGGKGTKPNYIPNYINQPISDPILMHNYRDINKEKWLAGKMKFY